MRNPDTRIAKNKIVSKSTSWWLVLHNYAGFTLIGHTWVCLHKMLSCIQKQLERNGLKQNEGVSRCVFIVRLVLKD